MTASNPPIQSRDNRLFKHIRSLLRSANRDRERAFLIEGARAVQDALAAGVMPQIVALRDDFEMSRLPDLPAIVPVRVFSAALFNDLSDTQHPQGVLAVVPMTAVQPGPAEPPLFMLADGIRDPGNLGTLLRSCAGAGVTAVYLTGGSVDHFNPKVVRSAMGAHFRVPIERLESLTDLTVPPGTRLVVTDVSSELPYDRVDLTGSIVIVVGGEASGVSDSLRKSASWLVAIPLATKTESLNAAVAGSILLFEARRQRESSR